MAIVLAVLALAAVVGLLYAGHGYRAWTIAVGAALLGWLLAGAETPLLFTVAVLFVLLQDVVSTASSVLTDGFGDFLANEAAGTNVIGTQSIEEFCAVLKRPRRVMLLVKAGKAVDDFIEALLPHLEPGAIVIDVGFTRDANGKLHGDVRFEECAERAGWITPVPGGVGPMTRVAMLQNTLLAAEGLVA